MLSGLDTRVGHRHFLWMPFWVQMGLKMDISNENSVEFFMVYNFSTLLYIMKVTRNNNQHSQLMADKFHGGRQR